MKIFLSHTSRDKAMIREFIGYLPPFLKTWLDENEIVWGGSLSNSIQSAIISEVDFLVIFISDDTLCSEWVNRELGWAYERETLLRRTFVLSIIIRSHPKSDIILPDELTDRLYIVLPDYNASSIRALAEKATTMLFQLIASNYDRLIIENMILLKNDNISSSIIKSANNFDYALKRLQVDSHQHKLVSQHVRTLFSNLLRDSERLRNKEFRTDYNDCSLLTKALDTLERNDKLIGLTDWDADCEWWAGTDASPDYS